MVDVLAPHLQPPFLIDNQLRLEGSNSNFIKEKGFIISDGLGQQLYRSGHLKCLFFFLFNEKVPMGTFHLRITVSHIFGVTLWTDEKLFNGMSRFRRRYLFHTQ